MSCRNSSQLGKGAEARYQAGCAMHRPVASRCLERDCLIRAPTSRIHQPHVNNRRQSRIGNSSRPDGLADPNVLANMFMSMARSMQEQQQPLPKGAYIKLDKIVFHPPGVPEPLLDQIDLEVAANQFGLVFGRSGSGKTTLLQLIAGLVEPTSGSIFASRNPIPKSLPGTAKVDASVAAPQKGVSVGLRQDELMSQVGLVFQFPERHFLGTDVLDELTLPWPRGVEHFAEVNRLTTLLQQVLQWVGMTDIPLHIAPWKLSGGQQRRLALAVQLVRQPKVLLLDEPLAGLDWRARQEVITLLRRIKQRCTLIVVSHDLKEISPLVDCAWRMQTGGRLGAVTWPPEDMSVLNT